MRKKLYDEFVAECESSCTDMYIAWLEDRVFALDTKVEKFTSYNSAMVQCPVCGAKCKVVQVTDCDNCHETVSLAQHQ